MMLLSFVLGILSFTVFLLVLRKLHRAFQVNGLLGFVGIYILFHFLDDKIAGILPESWKVEQFTNLFQLKGALGVMLNLHEPMVSTFDVTSIAFRLCLLGYFIYNLGIKRFLEKKKIS